MKVPAQYPFPASNTTPSGSYVIQSHFTSHFSQPSLLTKIKLHFTHLYPPIPQVRQLLSLFSFITNLHWPNNNITSPLPRGKTKISGSQIIHFCCTWAQHPSFMGKSWVILLFNGTGTKEPSDSWMSLWIRAYGGPSLRCPFLAKH